LSFREVGEQTAVVIRAKYGLEAVRPEVHSPRQVNDDIAGLPIFPNRICPAQQSLSEVRGLVLRYDSDTEEPPFGSWTNYCTTPGERPSPFSIDTEDGALCYYAFEAVSREDVGINKSLNLLKGFIKFRYKVLWSSNDNVAFYAIPMQETGFHRSGLIEVGSDQMDDPKNAFSTFRVRLSSMGEASSEWLAAELSFDFTLVETAFYTIFGPRINEGCKQPGPARVLIANVKVFGA
jgi:hypothetical protein